MTIMQTLDLEIANAIKGNDLYIRYLDRWKFLLESYLGGDEYRQGAHLTRYQLETDAEYTARLRNTPYENHCKSVISVYNSFLFRQEPEREFGVQEDNPVLEDFLDDADFEGRTFDAFMKDVATWSSVFGHCWIMVAKPNIGAATLAEEQAAGVRPYVSLLTPLVVLDWRWERDATGRYTLSYFKYVEDINGDVRTIKEWTPTTITTKVIDLKNRTMDITESVDNGLGVIPAVIAYSNRSTVRGIGVSAITDIADACKFIYNATSEVDQSIRLDSHPSLVATPETQIGTGAGALIRMPENMDPGLRPYVLDFNGASVDSIYAAIKHSIETIDKMANTGGVRATETRTQSGIALETEFQLLNARLSEMGDSLELAEEQIWRLWCLYQGYAYDFEIEYPDSFNIRDTGNEIAQLSTAKGAATSPAVLAAIDAKIIEWLDLDAEDDAEEAPLIHAETTPENRAMHIQEMIMEGLTDQQILDLHPEITQEDIVQAKEQLLNLGE
jgi:hypothetical protein